METKYFKCTLLSDVVLNAQTATEGSPECLDYIPGSNFLGMIAYQMYKDLGEEKAFDVLHGGKVRFCDARKSKDGKIAYKVPAAWFAPKGMKLGETEKVTTEGKTEIITATRVHHKITDWDSMIKNGIQLKQARKGYFIPGKIEDNKLSKVELIDIELNYNQKSAHDKEKRRSKDGKMFGYQSIEQGSEFIFKVEFDNETYLSNVIEALEGTKRLGRSKTAQYGLVEIKSINKPENIIKPIPEKNEINQISDNKELVIYAESDLCFFDEYGEPTLQPKASDFGISGEIVWDKTQILSRSYAPWNGKRKNREADRIVISKGSVIVIKDAKGTENLKTNVGYYKTEGLGQVIYNPIFLKANSADGRLNLTITESSKAKSEYIAINYIGRDDSKITSLLRNRKQRDTNKIFIHDKISDFVTKYRNTFHRATTASQWGGVRSRAVEATSKAKLHKDLFEIIPENRTTNTKEQRKGYVVHGKAEWKPKQLKTIEMVFKNDFGLDEKLIPTFVEKLAAQMQKECQKSKERRQQ